jgi:hypothetical protein
MPIKYVKMFKNGSWEYIQEDRVNRFLEEGWTLENQSPVQGKKSPAKGRKNKITADAQVTSIKAEETEEWDPTTGEDWADSIESIVEEQTEDDSNNAKEEN